jgi:SAM-dependent methyltransferase
MRPLARYVDENRLFGRHGFTGLDWHCRAVLGKALPVRGRALEIGAGAGLMSLWLLAQGADEVVSLEPEAAGSTDGVAGRAAAHRAALAIPPERWDYRAETLQEFVDARPYQLVLSHASINHLDEDACMRLGESPDARRRYLEIFTRIRRLLAPGGHFVVADCGRVNLWARLGRPSPWAPEIEWDKHQEPETWCALLGAAGLEPVDTRWLHPFFRTRHLQAVLGLRPIARCLASSFVIAARRASPGPE